MRSSFIFSLVLSAPFLLSACGGGVVATSTEGSGGSAGDGGSGGSGGTGGGPGTTTSTSTGPGLGPGDCPLLAVLKLSDPKATDDGGDGKWSPGEGALVTATMTNPTDTDVQYPGITWSSNQPLVSSGAPYNAFYVIFAGTSMPIDVGFAADSEAPIGTQAQLTGKLTDIMGNVCNELPVVTLDVVIE